ncbi:protein translocase subunit SecD [Nocardioides mangrovi]|uniref:Protein translocase subunit SecD n=1 Tax=Nocardioides mangrovi TaxID=2874580 RepID=A0ABS7UKM6_9ACTN|nr:protein translocase subunit SecD [Nocardioides mangrovi]MBZ5741178.1 protein translocase subunit SecD [Nocardioides mangrovi]
MAKRNAAAHAGRTLLVFAAAVAVLYGLVAIGGNWKPQLGLDLQGGTRITLTAADNPSKDNLEEAAKIIDERVNSSGFSEAEVTTQGDQYIVVEVPGDTSNSLIETVERQAQLRFRTVACSSSVPGPCATSSTDTGTGTQTLPNSSTGSSSGSGKSGNSKGDTSGKGSAKNRPGFLVDKTKSATKADKSKGAKPSSSASPSDSATPTETATPSESPSASTGSDSGNDSKAQMGLDFMSSPGQDAIDAYNAYSCPAKKPVEDKADQFLVTCGTGDTAGQKYLLSPAVIEGTDLTDASAGVQSGQVAWQVNLTLGGDAKKTFADLSRAMYTTDQQFAIVLDGNVISDPGFDGVITDGNAMISGGFTDQTAKSLATSLKFGALPISFEKDGKQVEQIGPSLAGNQLTAGLTAGALGLILVMIYCLLYYRGLGLVVLASLLTAGAITYALVLLLGHTAGFTLTLPGIAGLIIGVGVTADSFIIFFERMRDEMREGRSMRVAVETGWRRARKTRLAANVVSLLSAAVLYFFAIGVVKGFGFALGLSTLIDLAILFWFTKPMVTFLARFKFFNGGGELSGLSASTLGIDRVAPSTGGKA